MSDENNKRLTHVAGTFLIQADGSFLNGAGIDNRREDKNTSIPKSYRDGVGNRVPYVSAQAWRRWLRNTLIEETGWPASELRAIDLSERGTTNKIAGELNPVDFPEDDIFGYMRAAKGQGRESTSDGEDEVRTEEESQRDEEVRFFKKITSDIKSVQTGKRGRGKKTQDATDNDQGKVPDTSEEKQGKKAKDLSEEERLKLARKVVEDLQKETEKRLALDEEAVEEEFRGRLGALAQMLREADDIKPVLPKFQEELANVVQAFNPGRLKALMRASPFSSSLLISIRRKGWEGLDKGFVHLKEGTPLPYNTEFYNTHLEGVFCLNYGRLGVFWNMGDRIELDEEKADRLLESRKIRIAEDHGKHGRVYEMTDSATERRRRAIALLKALAVLRGGAKQAQFGTDTAPKALILAGLTCGNPIFNHLFMDSGEGPTLEVDTFKEIIRDYADRIVTPILIGLRAGYVKNDGEVRKLNGWWQIKREANESSSCSTHILEGPSKHKLEGGEWFEVRVMTPPEVATCIGELLP